MSFVSANDPRFFGATDSETIQNAIDFAKEQGIETVLIPRENERTKSELWVIDSAVLLPDHITVELDGAHLRLADGVRDNIFRNQNCATEKGATLDGEQCEIHLVGKNGAVLDGGTPNGMSETLCREHPDEYPSMKVNLLVWFCNVRDFSVEGISFIESRWWATCFHYCRHGLLSDLDFHMDATLPNRDGIDIRVGCEEIVIQNITGLTGDDTIALTALSDAGLDGRLVRVEGKHNDIQNITIQNVRAASCGCALVRLLNADGYVMKHIRIDGVEDTGEAISAAGIRFGEENARYAKVRPRIAGEFSDITVRNLTTSAQYAMIFAEPTERVTVEHVRAEKTCAILARFCPNFTGNEIRMTGLTMMGEDANCVFYVKDGADLSDCKIDGVTVGKVVSLFRGNKIPVSGFHFLDEVPDELAFGSPGLPSIYTYYLKN
ncbi:MAG: hypothetical protein IJR88_03045 [Clostridia bacterium]|nr:hypothetical protein [Clostridia bacterium]MBQ7173074.1 hypothetical protein [Clostridia bacterium]